MPLTRPKIWDVDTDIGFFKDPITVLHQGSTSANNDVGFLFNRANGLVSNVALVWQESSKSIVHVLTNDSGVADSNVSVTSYANVTIGNVLMIANAGLYINGSLGNPGQVLASDGTKVYWTSSTFPGGYVANQSTFASNLVANSGTTSTSVTSGALVVVGGTGISGALYIQNTGDVSANIGTIRTNLNTLDANVGAYETYANANVVAIQANLGAYQTFSNANAASQQTQINNIVSTANANTAAYLSLNSVSISSLSVTAGTESTSPTTGALKVTGGVGISGNLFVNGNVYTSNLISIAASTLSVQDPLLYLTANTITPYNYDIGFYSQFQGGATNNYQHTGLARNYSNDTWGLFSNVITEPGTTINWADTSLIWDRLKLGQLTVANNTISTSTASGALVVSGGVGIAGALYIANTNDVSANIGAIRTSLTTLDANVGAYQTYANANVVAIQANLGAYQTYANANVVAIQANLGAYQSWANTSITSLYTSANANTAAYLTTYTGNIQAGNITVTGNINATSNVFANLLYVASGLRWSGNGLAISTGGGSGTSLIYTAATTPPPSGNVTGDQWYNTSTDILYEYINDGTTSYWVDIQSLGTTGNITLMSDATLAGNIVVGVDTRYSIGAAGGYLRNLYTSNLFANTGTISGNLTTGNVTTGIITATGNVNAANLTTAGIATVSGNITSGNIVTGIITATGNVNAANLTTAGNVVAAYHIGDGSKLTNTLTTGKAIAMSIVFGG